MDPKDPDSVIDFLQLENNNPSGHEDRLRQAFLVKNKTNTVVGGIQSDLEGFHEKETGELVLRPLLQILKCWERSSAVCWEQSSAVLLNNFTAPAASRFLRVLGGNPFNKVLVLNNGAVSATDLASFITTSKSIEEVSIHAIEFQAPDDPVTGAAGLAEALVGSS
jgi:hypothetical protein